jgi:hypothetical protein
MLMRQMSGFFARPSFTSFGWWRYWCTAEEAGASV